MLIRSRLLALAAAAPLACALAGCHVTEHHNGNGGDNVNIDVPFASVHVKTDKEADSVGVGLAVYPGAVPVKEDNGKDKDAADVNMSFGDFHLGVKAASYQTGDSEDKVEAFYRKELAHYGDVIKCEGSRAVGQPTRTSQGLTCDDDHHNGKHVNLDVTGDSSPDLRAGSPYHQHIVGLEAKGGGTKIGLVMLDLPHSSGHEGKESE